MTIHIRTLGPTIRAMTPLTRTGTDAGAKLGECNTNFPDR